MRSDIMENADRSHVDAACARDIELAFKSGVVKLAQGALMVAGRGEGLPRIPAQLLQLLEHHRSGFPGGISALVINPSHRDAAIR